MDYLVLLVFFKSASALKKQARILQSYSPT